MGILDKKVDYDDIKFIAESKNRKNDFTRRKGPAYFFNEIKKGEITIQQAKVSLENFNNYPKTIRRGSKT